MDHIVYLDSRSEEMENLLQGNKSMIIRGAHGRKIPHGSVSPGDTLYLVNNNCEGEIKAKATVSSVFCSGMLTTEESFETIIRNQDKLQLPDKQFEKIAGKRFLVLISLENIVPVDPFKFSREMMLISDDWFPVGKIEEFILSARE